MPEYLWPQPRGRGFLVGDQINVMLLSIWTESYYGNTVHTWAISLSFATGAWILARAFYWVSDRFLGKLTARTSTKLDDLLLVTLRGPLVVLLTIAGFVVGYQQLDFPGHVDRWTGKVFHAAIAIAVTWLIARLLDALLREYLTPYTQRTESTLDDHMLPVVRKGTAALIWGLGIVVALNNAGYDVGALLAGIGIGGLAIAMAAKDTMANIFGGITVYTDKPFRVGDRVRINDYDGEVLEVGIRSTRIRTLEGPVVVVPNHKFTDSLLENVTQEPSRRVRHDLGLIYETPPEKMELALRVLKEIVTDHQEVLEEDHLASFVAFKDYSLNILFIYFIRKEADIFATQTRVHLEIMRRFHANGLSFAYPTAVELQASYKG